MSGLHAQHTIIRTSLLNTLTPCRRSTATVVTCCTDTICGKIRQRNSISESLSALTCCGRVGRQAPRSSSSNPRIIRWFRVVESRPHWRLTTYSPNVARTIVEPYHTLCKKYSKVGAHDNFS